MTLRFEPYDVWNDFAKTSPSAIRQMINERVYHMVGSGYSSRRIQTAIEVMQSPLSPRFQMDEGMMEQLIASKQKANYEPPSPRRSRMKILPLRAAPRVEL
jgi:hypothetical protein